MAASDIGPKIDSLKPEGLQKRKDECLLTIRRTMLVLVTLSLTSLILLAKRDMTIFLRDNVGDIRIPQVGINLEFNQFLVVGPIVLVVVWAYMHAFLSELRGHELNVVSSREPALPSLTGPLPALMTWLVEKPLVPAVLLVFAFKAGFSEWNYFWSAGAVLAWFLAFGIPAWQNTIKRDWVRTAAYSISLAVGLYISILPQSPNLGPTLELRDILRLNLEKLDLSTFTLKLCEKKGGEASEDEEPSIDFKSVRLTYVNLRGALLPCADMIGMSAPNGDFTSANLQQAKLIGSDLSHAVIANAELNGAELDSASLIFADLTSSDLRGARFMGADLRGAVLNGADITEADFTTAFNLTKEQIKSACYQSELGNVKLPEDFGQPPECPKIESDSALQSQSLNR